jgi:Uma2 family endonuclease
MGDRPTAEALVARWRAVLDDPSLRDLPHKIELNERGTLEMSPASNVHAYLQFQVGMELTRTLPLGTVLTEASLLTRIGIRVADVVWASPDFIDDRGLTTLFTSSQEICVEVVSPANSRDEIAEKVAAYVAAGAKEVWVVGEDASIRFHGAEGARSASVFGIVPELVPPPLARR